MGFFILEKKREEEKRKSKAKYKKVKKGELL